VNGDILGQLLDHGIRVRRLLLGAWSEQIICPRCGGGSHREKSLSVKLDEDGQGAVWICHRGTCGWKDSIRANSDFPRTRSSASKEKVLPEHTYWDTTNQPDWLYEFFAERHIGKVTVDRFGVYAMNRTFPGLGQRPAIVFPYRFRGEDVARKYRPYPEKQPQSQENNGTPTLFNIDAIAKAETVYFVEGEPDVMAMHECGYPATVSLRDGAPATVKANPSDLRFAALETHAEELTRVKNFVLAGDMDKPGLALREELARRLGRHRVSIVTWPEGCKDACDALRKGFEYLQQAIDSAEPYPIEGVRKINSDVLLKDRPRYATMGAGTIGTDREIKLPTEGRLIVLTGFPQHGKSSWTRFVAVHTARNHDRRWAIFSPEHQPWEDFAEDCAAVYRGKPFHEMSEEDKREAGDFLNGRISMLVSDSESTSPTVDWLIEQATMLLLRDGTTDLLLDPWNEVEHHYGDLAETEYVARCLRRFKAFALRHGCNVWIAVHPAKPQPKRNGEERDPPAGYEISGSAHWANKCDLGLTIWRPEKETISRLIAWKSRFRRFAQRGAIVRLGFDATTGRYLDPMIDDLPPPSKPWNET